MMYFGLDDEDISYVIQGEKVVMMWQECVRSAAGPV